MQRCPQVPTAPKTVARIAISRSASLLIMIALFPPNSRILLPNRPPTTLATSLPIRMEPVADINGILESVVIHSPNSRSPVTKLNIPSGRLFSLSTLATIF